MDAERIREELIQNPLLVLGEDSGDGAIFFTQEFLGLTDLQKIDLMQDWLGGLEEVYQHILNDMDFDMSGPIVGDTIQ